MLNVKLGVVPPIVHVTSRPVPSSLVAESRTSVSSVVVPVACVWLMMSAPSTARLMGSTCWIFTLSVGVVPEAAVTFRIDLSDLADILISLVPVAVSVFDGWRIVSVIVIVF